jgi:hypothetical protein
MRKLFCPVVFLLCAAPLLAQSAPPATNPPSQNRPARRGGQESCGQQAGIEKSVMEQIRTIGHDARSQVESICSDSSLTPQQKQQKAREIREQAMEKRDALMTADQRKALRACQQQRSGNHAGGGEHQGAGGGCGEMPRTGRPGGSPNGAPGNGNGTSNPRSNPPKPQS